MVTMMRTDDDAAAAIGCRRCQRPLSTHRAFPLAMRSMSVIHILRRRGRIRGVSCLVSRAMHFITASHTC
jgi:hypothetical protein